MGTYQNQIRITSKPLRNRIKTVPKLYQNHISTVKTEGKITKSLSRGCFCFFVSSQPTETLKKDVPFLKQYQNHQNHIKTISRRFQNRIKTMSNHIKTTKCPGAFSASFFQANPSETLRKLLLSQTIPKPRPKLL